MTKYKYLIIGGGITGITLGRLLQMRGENDFIILESENEAGGLCKSKNISGHNLDVGGGHFLYTKYKDVYDFIFSHIPKKEFDYYDRVSKVKIGEDFIDYPVESNLWQLPINKQSKFLISIAQAGEISNKKEPKNYQDWIEWKLGDLIASEYMIPYNKKIWGVEPKEMDIDWLHKIPRVNIEEIFESSLSRHSDTSKYPSHPGFYYPKVGGFQSIFNSIYKKITKHVLLNNPVKSLINDGEKWIINNSFQTEIVINTAPWTNLYDALNKPKTLKNNFLKLKSNRIVVSLWEENYKHNWHWLYDPSLKIQNHREFYIHNFSKSSLPNGVYTETNIKRWNSKKFTRNGKKPIYEYINKESYPIPVKGHSAAIRNILDHYKKLNLFGVGRWGQWQYFNSDVCMKEAIDFIKNLA